MSSQFLSWDQLSLISHLPEVKIFAQFCSISVLNYWIFDLRFLKNIYKYWFNNTWFNLRHCCSFLYGFFFFLPFLFVFGEECSSAEEFLFLFSILFHNFLLLLPTVFWSILKVLFFLTSDTSLYRKLWEGLQGFLVQKHPILLL